MTSEELDAMAGMLSEAQRRYLTTCPATPHHNYDIRPAGNFGGAAKALCRMGILARTKDRPWDVAATFEYHITPLGRALRARLEKHNDAG